MLLVTLAGSGCGGNSAEVSGTVTYQGKAVTLGSVTFVGANNEEVGTSAISNGRYSIRKLPSGPVKILVKTPPPLPANSNNKKLKSVFKPKVLPPKQGGNEPEKPSGDRSAPRVVVPAKYGDPDQSGLTYTVQSGKQEHNIELP